jgi:hypothetical protein
LQIQRNKHGKEIQIHAETSLNSTYVARVNRNAIKKIWLNSNQNYLAKIATLLPKSENQEFLVSKLPI